MKMKMLGAIVIFYLVMHMKVSAEIWDKYTPIVKKIKNITQTSEFKHQAYEKTAYMVDTIGSRLWGSDSLELAINHVRDLLKEEKFENVRTEEVPNAIKWVRGREFLTLYDPRTIPINIPMIGLGLTIAGDIKEELVVFKDIDDLEKNSAKADGKIVFLNTQWTTYSQTVKSRVNGPSIAAKYGALACLIRSVTPESLETPHTGIIKYNPNYPKIPAAAVSLETADMFQRMTNRGQKIVVRLYTEGRIAGYVSSNNLIGEIKGYQAPNEIILIGGHIDSWDAGPQTGAYDDAAGMMVCLQAMSTLIKLGLRPRRTIRFIAWSGEEIDGETSGAQAYVSKHVNEMHDHIVAFESDMGTKNIWGWGYTGDDTGYAIIKNINSIFLRNELNITKFENNMGIMSDTAPLYQQFKIPVMTSLVNETTDDHYLFTHVHSGADTVSALDPDGMDSNVVAIASMFYIIADLPTRIPRGEF